MTAKDNYSDSEWQLLLDVPPAVGTAIMIAGRSGLGSVKEAMALASGILGARDGYDGNELIEALVNSRIKEGKKSSIETLNSPYRGMQPEQVLEDAIAKCQDVRQLLHIKATPRETEDYKQWTLTIAQRVAEAAKEGGFLGIGGERVSDAEQVAIDRIAQALDLNN